MNPASVQNQSSASQFPSPTTCPEPHITVPDPESTRLFIDNKETHTEKPNLQYNQITSTK